MTERTTASARGLALLLAAAPLWLTGCEDGRLDHPFLERMREARRAPVAFRLADPMPRLTLPEADGDSVRLVRQRGETATIVNLWATWCVPCRAEMPDLVSLHRDWRALGVRVVGIAVDSDPDDVRSWVEEYRIDFPILRGLDGEGMALHFRSRGVPRTYLADSRGVLRLVLHGEVTRGELEAILVPFLRDGSLPEAPPRARPDPRRAGGGAR